MPIDDRTNDAARMSDSFRGSRRNSTSFFGTKEDIDELVEYMVEKVTKSSKKVIKDTTKEAKNAMDESFRTHKTAVADAQKALKSSMSFSNVARNSLDKATNGLVGAWSNYSKAMKELKSGNFNAQIFKQGKSGAVKLGQVIGAYIEAALKWVTRQYTDYAQKYETYLPTTSTNLGTTRYGYSDLLQGANKEIYNQGLSWTTSMHDVMKSMDDLAASGIQTNLESLSVIESMATRISTTWDVSTISDQLRVHGADSGIYEYTLGAEAMLRDTLKDQFGDTQYVQNGMYKTTRAALQTLLVMQETAEQSAEIEYAIQSGVASIYEAGISKAGVDNLIQGIQDLTTKGYTDNIAVLDAVNRAGLDMSNIHNWGETEYAKLTQGYADMLESMQQDTVVAAGAMAEIYGGATSDFMANSETLDKLRNLDLTGVTSSEDLYDKLKDEQEEAADRHTWQQSITKQLKNITGLLGGNYISQAGSGIVGAVGGAISTVAGIGGGYLATKLLGNSLGSGLGNLLKGGATKKAAGGLVKNSAGQWIDASTGKFVSAAQVAGTNTIGGVAGKFLTNANGGGMGAIKGVGYTGLTKTLGGVGFGISAISDGSAAVKNNTYSNNDTVNAIAGGLLGNYSGEQSFGGYAKSVGSGAMKGAAFGTMFGPWGTLIGAGVGAIAGVVGNIWAGNKKKKDEASQASQTASASTQSNNIYDSILQTINQSINMQTDRIINAMTNMYNMLYNSLGATKDTVVKPGDYLAK